MVAEMNKTAFVTDMLQNNPTANAQAVRDAWTEAGREGSVSVTLVQRIRSELGLVGNLRGGRKQSAEAAGAAAKEKPKKRRRVKNSKLEKANGHHTAEENGAVDLPAASRAETTAKKAKTNERDMFLTAVEGDIDRLIFKLIVAGGLGEVEDALRAARRVVVRSHKG